MSKQIKLKFQKLLKNAEFVQADVNYHEELLPEAKQEFFSAAQEVLNNLPDDIQNKFERVPDCEFLTKIIKEEDCLYEFNII